MFKKWKFENSKSRKAEKSDTFWFFAKKRLKGRKNRTVEKTKPFWLCVFFRKVAPEKSKTFWFFDFLRRKMKSRKVKNFLTFGEKLCNFRAVRLPARGALSWEPPWIIAVPQQLATSCCAEVSLAGCSLVWYCQKRVFLREIVRDCDSHGWMCEGPGPCCCAGQHSTADPATPSSFGVGYRNPTDVEETALHEWVIRPVRVCGHSCVTHVYMYIPYTMYLSYPILSTSIPLHG